MPQLFGVHGCDSGCMYLSLAFSAEPIYKYIRCSQTLRRALKDNAWRHDSWAFWHFHLQDEATESKLCVWNTAVVNSETPRLFFSGRFCWRRYWRIHLVHPKKESSPSSTWFVRYEPGVDGHSMRLYAAVRGRWKNTWFWNALKYFETYWNTSPLSCFGQYLPPKKRLRPTEDFESVFYTFGVKAQEPSNWRVWFGSEWQWQFWFQMVSTCFYKLITLNHGISSLSKLKMLKHQPPAMTLWSLLLAHSVTHFFVFVFLKPSTQLIAQMSCASWGSVM